MWLLVIGQNPLNKLRDLADLKDQLEDIQRRVEDEVQAGVPQVLLECSIHTHTCIHPSLEPHTHPGLGVLAEHSHVLGMFKHTKHTHT